MFTILVFGILLLIALLTYTRYLERTSVFYPSRDVVYTPADIGFPYEEVTMSTEDGLKLNGWLLKRADAKSVLLYLHGNAGNIGSRLSTIRFHYQSGLNVLIVDYRGFGNSQGSPSESGLYKDASAMYDFIKSRADLKDLKLIIYGASLGGVPAVDLASRRESDALVLDSTFTSATDMAKRIYPYVPSFFLSLKMDSVNKIRSVAAPKLFLHSPVDAVVPYDLGQRLYDAASEPKYFVETSGKHDEMGSDDNEAVVEAAYGAFLSQYDLR